MVSKNKIKKVQPDDLSDYTQGIHELTTGLCPNIFTLLDDF